MKSLFLVVAICLRVAAAGVFQGERFDSPCETVTCYVNPCHVATCDVSQAVCRPDYCGGCNARWYVHGWEIESCRTGRH